MNLPLVVALLLGAGVLLGSVRSLRDAHPRAPLRCALHLLAGIALWYGLFPPAVDEAVDASTLVVLAPGAQSAPTATLPRGSRTVALPGAGAPGLVERVPDLATALRRHPEARHLHVVGAGLPARDREAARGRVVAFDAAPLPAGLVELDAPAQVAPGARWRVAGRLEGLAGGRIELLDPSGDAVAAAAPEADGRFMLEAHAKGEGRAVYALRVSDAAGTPRERVDLPLRVRGGEAVRMHVLAGAPDPDLKYLRRWAADAGIDLDSRIRLSDGVALSEGDVALDAAALAQVDLVVIDERAWMLLATGERKAVRDAVDQGLGLLLRITGPLDDAVAADWAELGFRVQATAAPVAVALAADGAHDAAALARQPVDVVGESAVPLLQAGDGTLRASWRALGQGRVGAWWLADSFRLVLSGDAQRHAALWASTVSTLARARAAAVPALPTDARVGERAVPCGLVEGASIESPSGDRVALVPVARGGAGACAAYWPAVPGWHVLHSGGADWPFHVRAAADAPGLAAAADARATRALVGGSEPASVAQQPVRLPRWPFLLAWLAVAGLLWWLERGRGSRATT